MEIFLFGSFEVKRDDRSLCASWSRHAHRLLALLILNHNRAISTDWILSALLLPESVLPQSLGVIYQVLGEEDRRRVRHQNRQIHFDTTGIKVDLFEFERLIARSSPETLSQAVKIHRGGLLKDWEEECWFSEERENCLAEYLDAMNSLTRDALNAQDYDLAASYLRRSVNAYPEMDGAWTRLVDVYGMTGNTSEIETTRRRYLEALRRRCEDEGREIKPSARFLLACDQAIKSALAPPAPVSTEAPDHFPSCSAPTGISTAEVQHLAFEPVGGTVPLDSPFYLTRPADALAFEALDRRDSFLLVKGMRQVGKSSLLARLLHRAIESGAQVVRSDWQKIPGSALETDRTFLRELAETFVDHLELAARPETHFELGRAGTVCFERFLKRDVLPAVSGSLVWVIDEADRVFDRPYRDDIFAMLRSWHGERANDFTGRWQKLTVILAYATEAYLFITNLDQSPFNVGTRIELDDFTRDQVGEMNRRYGSPAQDSEELKRLYALLGGHPSLIRRCMQEMRQNGLRMDDVEASVERGDSLFKDHLGRMRLALQRDPEMEAALRTFLKGESMPEWGLFLRLRAAGVMRGDSPQEMHPRCRLYDTYLHRLFA